MKYRIAMILVLAAVLAGLFFSTHEHDPNVDIPSSAAPSQDEAALRGLKID